MKWKDWKLSTLELFSISWLFYNLGNKNTSYTENHEEKELEEIKESDFSNKRKYNAACALARSKYYKNIDEEIKKEIEICKFILEKSDSCVAARYLSHKDGFLYAQAIKDNFDLPCAFPDEDAIREMYFYEIFDKLLKRNIDLTLEIWEWCLKEFIPYRAYDQKSSKELIDEIFLDFYNLSDEQLEKIISYLNEKPEFVKLVLDNIEEKIDITLLIPVTTAIDNKFFVLAKKIFEKAIFKADNHWRSVKEFIESVINFCKNDNEVESMEYFLYNLFPMVKKLEIDMVRDEIEYWEKEIKEYIQYVEENLEKYEYSRKNSWRKFVPNGEKYGLSVLDFDDPETYCQEFEKAKYAWREYYKDSDNRGLDPNKFETEEEFYVELSKKLTEK